MFCITSFHFVKEKGPSCHVTYSFLIHIFIEPDDGYISRNLVAQSFLIKQRKELVVTDFFSEELKHIPCIHTPTGMFNIKIYVACLVLHLSEMMHLYGV
jgi:hypothetical protein